MVLLNRWLLDSGLLQLILRVFDTSPLATLASSLLPCPVSALLLLVWLLLLLELRGSAVSLNHAEPVGLLLVVGPVSGPIVSLPCCHHSSNNILGVEFVMVTFLEDHLDQGFH